MPQHQQFLVADPSPRRDQRLEGRLQPPPQTLSPGLSNPRGLRCCLHPPITDSHSRWTNSRGPVRTARPVRRRCLRGRGRSAEPIAVLVLRQLADRVVTSGPGPTGSLRSVVQGRMAFMAKHELFAALADDTPRDTLLHRAVVGRSVAAPAATARSGSPSFDCMVDTCSRARSFDSRARGRTGGGTGAWWRRAEDNLDRAALAVRTVDAAARAPTRLRGESAATGWATGLRDRRGRSRRYIPGSAPARGRPFLWGTRHASGRRPATSDRALADPHRTTPVFPRP